MLHISTIKRLIRRVFTWLYVCFDRVCIWLVVRIVRSDEQKKIYIIVPSYNNEQWVKRNLDSLCTQRYINYHVIYIDDCSTDVTTALVRAYITKHALRNKVTLVQNTQRLGALQNLYIAINGLQDTDIVVLCDGDDWLAHADVLAYINLIYTKKRIVLSYGSYINTEGRYVGEPIPQAIIKQYALRNLRWVSSHLRTFYAGLFKQIKKEDLLYQDQFFATAWDLAIMFPMIEMAQEKAIFVPSSLYIYNLANPISDFRKHKEQQLFFDKIIRAKQPYKKLQSLDFLMQ